MSTKERIEKEWEVRGILRTTSTQHYTIHGLDGRRRVDMVGGVVVGGGEGWARVGGLRWTVMWKVGRWAEVDGWAWYGDGSGRGLRTF